MSLLKNIILLQTRRIGDLFQTKPLIDNLLEKFNNQCNIFIVVDDNFKNIQNDFNQNVKLIGKKEFYKYYYNNYILTNNLNNVSLLRLNYDNYNNYNKVNNNFNIRGDKCCNTYNDEHKYSENNDVCFDVKKLNDDVKIDEIYFDEAINLNFDIINSVILNTIEAEHKYGFVSCGKSDKKKEIICRSKAANYFYNTVRYRNQNRINIVDIFSLIGSGRYYSKNCNFNSLKLKKLLPDLNSNKNNKSKQSQKINSDKLRFLFVPASSNPKRDWSVEEYITLIGLIAQTFKSEIILLGTQKEAEIADKIKSYFKINQDNKDNNKDKDKYNDNDANVSNLDINNANNIINNIIDLTGRTNLNELIDIMQTGDFIISPDTGLLQIASALELDSVSIFLGNANIYETGPYFSGAFAISPIEDCYPCIEHIKCDKNYACKNNIKADDIFNLIKIKIYEKYKSDISKYILNNNTCNNNNDSNNNNNNNDNDKNKINYDSYFKCKKLIKEALNKKKFNVYKCDTSFSISYAGFFKLKPEKNDLIAEILKYSWINLFVFDIKDKISYENAVKNIKKKYLIKLIKKESDFNNTKNNDNNNNSHYINNKIEKDINYINNNSHCIKSINNKNYCYKIVKTIEKDFNYLKDIFKNAQKISDIEDEKIKQYELENFKNFLMDFKENYFEYSAIFDYFIYEFEYILKNKLHNDDSNFNINIEYIFDDIIYIIDFGLIILDNLVHD
ncbi:MAG: glycosyltransferase family 9 protein [bacterium]